MVVKHGVYLSDLHLPDSIPLSPVMNYLADTKPSIVILGGDIIDAQGLHASESMKAEQVKMSWFKRDVGLVAMIVGKIRQATPSAEIIFLEGNHEQRYARLQNKYPDLFASALDFGAAVSPYVKKYIPYGKADSYHRVGDTVFIHGDIFPDAHAKAYSMRYNPYKVVYGHLHHYQAYTSHRALLNEQPRYALTAGCLSTLNPEWRHGRSNQWVNGFVSFWTDGKTTVPTAHMMERGRLFVGGKEY